MYPVLPRFSPCLKLSLCLLLMFFLFLPVSSFAQSQPVELIMEIGEAIDNSDAQEFAQLVDMDEILNNAIDVFVAEASRPDNASRLPPMVALLVSQLATNAPSPVRDLLIGEAKNFVLTGISSGAFAGKKPDLSNSSGLLAPLFAQASMGRKEIRDIGAPTPVENGWIVPFVIYDHDNGNEYPIKGRVEDTGTDLKLTGIENMRQLIYQIGEESQRVQ